VLGYGGNKADSIVDRVKEWANNQGRARVVVYHAGINDFRTAKGPGEFDHAEENISREVRRLIDLCRGEKIKIILCSIPPIPGI